MTHLNEQLTGLEQLAALRIPDEKREKLVGDLESILSYVEQLQAIDVPDADFERAVTVGDEAREDVAITCSDGEREAVLLNAPVRTSDDLFEAHAALEHK